MTELVSDEELDEVVGRWTARLADGPTVALGAAKRLVLQAWDTSLEEHLRDEAATIAGLVDSPTGAEGSSAFLEAANPCFVDPALAPAAPEARLSSRRR